MENKINIDYSREPIKLLVKSIYDEQKLRIQMGNRIAANFQSKLGCIPGEKIEDEDTVKILDRLRKENKRITDAMIDNKVKLDIAIKNENGLITNEFENALVIHYIEKIQSEDKMLKTLDKIVKKDPLWINFLAGVKGCGTLMAAVCISELDPYTARHVSSYWKYAGLDVKDGKGRSLQKHHLEDREYTSKEGEIKIKKSITYNPFLKTKLMGVLAPCFLRSRSSYTKAYYDYKERQINQFSEITGYDKKGDAKREFNKGITLAHIEMRSRRYMIKQFLADLWKASRELEGLPVTERYEVAILGRNPHGYNYTNTEVAATETK